MRCVPLGIPQRSWQQYASDRFSGIHLLLGLYNQLGMTNDMQMKHGASKVPVSKHVCELCSPCFIAVLLEQQVEPLSCLVTALEDRAVLQGIWVTAPAVKDVMIIPRHGLQHISTHFECFVNTFVTTVVMLFAPNVTPSGTESSWLATVPQHNGVCPVYGDPSLLLFGRLIKVHVLRSTCQVDGFRVH